VGLVTSYLEQEAKSIVEDVRNSDLVVIPGEMTYMA
jgi:hypothetical protein